MGGGEMSQIKICDERNVHSCKCLNINQYYKFIVALVDLLKIYSKQLFY